MIIRVQKTKREAQIRVEVIFYIVTYFPHTFPKHQQKTIYLHSNQKHISYERRDTYKAFCTI